MLKGQYRWLVFETFYSSEVFHILMADGIPDHDEILVRVNCVEKFLLFLRGYPEISLTNGGNKSAIYDGTSPLLTKYITCSFCCCLPTDRFVQPHSLYNCVNHSPSLKFLIDVTQKGSCLFYHNVLLNTDFCITFSVK